MAKFYVRIGGAVGDIGEIKYGWNTDPRNVENIQDELGIRSIDADADAKGIAFGINTPKPPRVRISWGKKETVQGQETLVVEGTRTIFCDTDKLGQVLGGSLRGKTLKAKRGNQWVDKEIGNVSIAS